MERKYDATYYSKTGKAVVHMVAPPSMTTEEIEAVLSNYRRVFRMWWDSLSIEAQLEFNNKAEREKRGDSSEQS